MKSFTKAGIVAAILASQFVFAHGEDKPGPNGGYIRMPGAFHTEVLLTSPNTLKVYLLDLQWKNPSTDNSSLFVNHTVKIATKVKCTTESNYYICKLPKDVDLTKKGKLFVEAKRQGQKGTVVSYELPFNLQNSESSHSSHH